MNYKIALEDDALTHFFKTAYNPPVFGLDFSEDDFDREFFAIRDQIILKLNSIGRFSKTGDGDYYIGLDRGNSRWVALELTTTRLWKPELIQILSDTLIKQEQKYMVYVSHSSLEYPLFHILVNKHEVVGWGDRSLLKKLGFGVDLTPISVGHLQVKEPRTPGQQGAPLGSGQLTSAQMRMFNYLKDQYKEVEPDENAVLRLLQEKKLVLLHDDAISDISLLSQLPNLERVSIVSESLSDIEPLKTIKKLKELSLEGIKAIDFNILAKLEKLETLKISHTGVCDLSFLNDLKQLETLSLSKLDLGSLKGFPNLPKLINLHLRQDKLESVADIPSLPSLTELWLSDNRLRDLSGVEKQKHLRVLTITRNCVQEMDLIAKLKNLRRLDASSNNVQDISPLCALKLLRELNISKNPIKTIKPMSQVKSLETIYLDANALTDKSEVNLFGSTKIEFLPV